MLEYDRIEIFEGIDTKKSLEYDRIDVSEILHSNKIGSHEWKVCHYWCFFKINVPYHPLVCKDYYDMKQKFLNLSDVEIVET